MTLFARLQRVVGTMPAAEVGATGSTDERPSIEPAPAAAPARVASGPSSLGHALARLRTALVRRDDRAERAAGTLPPATGTEVAPTLGEALPGGSALATEHGPTWAVDTEFALTDRHGDEPLGRAFATPYDHLELLTADPRLAGFDPRDALYLDIEATGLEHGAGTLAFMVGLGSFDGRCVRVRQLILREPDEEKAMLRLLWEAIDAHRFLVSFNGKSFDLSVLQSRLVMNRFCTPREGELKLRPHLDLLHLGRGLFKKVWADVRLQTLEARVLGFVREDDMPGSMAPACWFRWLREADPRPLAGIARHNLFDVLSMVSLAGVLAREARPVGDAGRRAAVALNLAALYARRRAPEAALAVLEELPPLSDFGERVRAHELGATCARRAKDTGRLRTHLASWLALDPAAERAQKALDRLDKSARRRGAA
ncbi:MAG: ribonuclease H-like domain-containing protein [Myxococcota bacterium]